ncbi:MAG: hypothetical protein IPO50_15140 [Sphingomonadales bacterium]|nr:hypothetical protein [Sphingomonadales bacterium]
MNTYNGFNLRNSVTAASSASLMVAGSMMFSATYTNVPRRWAYTILTPQA